MAPGARLLQTAPGNPCALFPNMAGFGAVHLLCSSKSFDRLLPSLKEMRKPHGLSEEVCSGTRR